MSKNSQNKSILLLFICEINSLNFSLISVARVCELHSVAAGALAQRVLPQHGAAASLRPRDVPGPGPHPQQFAHGDSHLPGTQVRSW